MKNKSRLMSVFGLIGLIVFVGAYGTLLVGCDGRNGKDGTNASYDGSDKINGDAVIGDPVFDPAVIPPTDREGGAEVAPQEVQTLEKAEICESTNSMASFVVTFDKSIDGTSVTKPGAIVVTCSLTSDPEKKPVVIAIETTQVSDTQFIVIAPETDRKDIQNCAVIVEEQNKNVANVAVEECSAEEISTEGSTETTEEPVSQVSETTEVPAPATETTETAEAPMPVQG